MWSVSEILPIMCAIRSFPGALPPLLRPVLKDWVKAVDTAYLVLGRDEDYIWTSDELKHFFAALWDSNSSRAWRHCLVTMSYALTSEDEESSLDPVVWDESISQTDS